MHGGSNRAAWSNQRPPGTNRINRPPSLGTVSVREADTRAVGAVRQMSQGLERLLVVAHRTSFIDHSAHDEPPHSGRDDRNANGNQNKGHLSIQQLLLAVWYRA